MARISDVNVLIGQGDGGESLLQLASTLIKSGARLQVLYLIDTQNEMDWSIWMRKAVPLVEVFLTRKELEDRLKEILPEIEKETETYIAGEEPFLCGVEKICASYGMKGEQIHRENICS